MLEIERKFLLKGEPVIPETALKLLIEQTYLIPPKGKSERVRLTLYPNRGTRYTHTIKTKVAAGIHEEEERELTYDEYIALLERADPSCEEVMKARFVVPHNDLKLEIDQFHYPVQFWMLEIELPDIDFDYSIPDWIKVEREVTNENGYSNRAIAAGSLKKGKGRK